MGYQLQRLAWERMPASLNTAARLVYAWLCHRAREDHDNTLWANVPEIMAVTALPERTTRRALTDLRKCGLIENLSPNGTRGRSQYRILDPCHTGTPATLAPVTPATLAPTPATLAGVYIVPTDIHREREHARTRTREGAAPPAVASAALSQRGLYETFVRVLGREPQRGKEHGRWQYGCQELHRDGVSPPEIPRLVDAYRAKFGAEIPCHPGTIHDHLPALRGGNHVTQRADDPATRLAAEQARRLETYQARLAYGLTLPPRAYAELAAAGIHVTPPDPAD